MMKKPTTGLGLVLPVVVLSKHIGCKHNCIYCPKPLKSCIPEISANNCDAYKQVKARLKALRKLRTKHATNKIELIITGCNFLEMPKDYQYGFVKSCYDAINDKKSYSLDEAKKINENAKNRVVAFCLDTKDVHKEDIQRALEFGVTHIELLVQALDDKILSIVESGNTVKDIAKITAFLKDSAFKVGYNFMLGLPGSDLKKDIKMYKKMFSDEKFKPDQLKIYPTQVVKGSRLEIMYNKGEYKPYTKDELIELLIRLKQLAPRYCRVMLIIREIPKRLLVAGGFNISLKQEITKIMKEQGIKCECIRCRETYGEIDTKQEVLDEISIKITKYDASKGKEFFIEALSNDLFFGLARLRFPYKPFIPELEDCAVLRELHVYGKALAIKNKGIGKKLLETAETIAAQSYDKIAVISGVGAREYYRKFGYIVVGNYMIKSI